MRITITTHLERDLSYGYAVQDQVTATADVDLANEKEPISWVSVERAGVPYSADELIDVIAPLSPLEDRILAEAMKRQGPSVAAPAAFAEERSVA
jgi:hypothetical protein